MHGICLTVNLPKAPIGSKQSLDGVRIRIAESEIQNTPWCVLAESKIQDTKGESRVFAIWFAICYTKGERFAAQKANQVKSVAIKNVSRKRRSNGNSKRRRRITGCANLSFETFHLCTRELHDGRSSTLQVWHKSGKNTSLRMTDIKLNTVMLPSQPMWASFYRKTC